MGIAGVSALTPFLLLTAALMAMLFSILLVGRYRRSVIRLMDLQLPAPSAAAVTTAGPPVPEPVPEREAARTDTWPRRPLVAVLDRRRRVHVAIAIGAGVVVGLVYALLALLWNDLEILPVRYTVLALVYSWPAVPAVWVASDGDRRQTAAVAAVLFLAPILVAGLAGFSVPQAIGFWLLSNSLATLVVVVFFTRSFRAIGVCLLGICLVALLGSFTLTGALDSPAVVEVAVSVIPDAVLVLVLAVLGGLVLAGLGGLLAFGALARWYARQGFSDHMLLMGSICLVFCLDYVNVSRPGRALPLLIGLILFGAVGVLAFVAYRLLVPALPAPTGLLVLRVFGDARAGRLLDTVASRWRHVGPVRLIAGPDLAVANVEPDEFLTYLTRRLRRLFVCSPQDLALRLTEPSPRPDPDGRYRVDEWFCLADTWQPTVQALVGRSDVILMDVRGFTAHRAGTRFELEVLARTGALGRTLLISDGTTDDALVESLLSGAAVGEQPRLLRLTDPDPAAVVRALSS